MLNERMNIRMLKTFIWALLQVKRTERKAKVAPQKKLPLHAE